MNFIIKAFNKEKYQFRSGLTVDELKTKMTEVCNKGFFDFSVNLMAKMDEDGNFKFTPAWQIGYTTGGGLNASIKCKILDAVNGSIVAFELKPNFSFIIFSTFSFIGGIIQLFDIYPNGIFNGTYLAVGLVFGFCVPAIMMTISYFSKRWLFKSFVVYFDLREET